MKPVVTLLGLFFALALTQANNVPAVIGSIEKSSSQESLKFIPNDMYMTQKLDHFSHYADDRTFNWGYMKNEDYYKKGGPIFIYIYGNRPASPWKKDHGIVVDLVKKYNGMLFYPELRFYGYTRPTKHLELKDLKYLTLNQTLADLANFIHYIRENDGRLENSKVIMSGCGYGGSVAIWFKKLYSDLVDGVWSTGAPVLAKLDFLDYKQVVGDAFLKQGSEQCFERIKRGIAQLQAMFAGNRREEAARILNLCSTFDYRETLNLQTLFYSISNVIEYRTKEDISEHCSSLMSYRNDVTAVAKFYVKQIGNGCIAMRYFDFMLPYRQDYPYPYEIGNERSWLYQQCNEFGWFSTSSAKLQPFGSSFPLDFFAQMCQDAFETKYTKEYMEGLVNSTNNYLGNKDLELKNVYITYGEMDPWRPVGGTNGSTMILGACHCSDLASITESDNLAMKKSKEQLFTLVEEWLK